MIKHVENYQTKVGCDETCCTHQPGISVRIYGGTHHLYAARVKGLTLAFFIPCNARMDMLQSIQAVVVQHGGCPVRSEVAYAKGRGDGNPAVRVRNVDPLQEALR